MTSVSYVGLNVDRPPHGWEVSRYKFHISIDNGFPFKSELFDPYDGFPLIRIRDITSGAVETRYLGEVLSEYVVTADELLVGMDGDFNTRWWDNENALLNQRCCRIKEGVDFHLRYLHYILPLQLKVINDLTYFTTVKHLSSFDILGDRCLIPPLDEQRLISRYLDKKTQQIDTLIEKIEKKIELLKEQRTSLINHYVTKGLDPNVEMKDSGVEWIGRIPKHWNLTRLKYLSETPVQYGLNIESDAYTESGVRFLRITDIGTDGSIKDTDGVYLSPTDVPTEYILRHGDFLISRSGASVGKSTLIESDSETTSYAGYLVRFSFSDPVVARFIKWVSESRMYWDWVSLQTTQSTIQNVNGDKYANFSLPVPPTEERQAIDHLLSQSSKKITKMISLQRERQRLLTEYRQSLISSVVTGKVRVIEDMI